jgi:predicted MFS family arabinose efflux permease
MVSPILLVFGAGLSAGNLLGGRFADRNLDRAPSCHARAAARRAAAA